MSIQIKQITTFSGRYASTKANGLPQPIQAVVPTFSGTSSRKSLFGLAFALIMALGAASCTTTNTPKVMHTTNQHGDTIPVDVAKEPLLWKSEIGPDGKPHDVPASLDEIKTPEEPQGKKRKSSW